MMGETNETPVRAEGPGFLNCDVVFSGRRDGMNMLDPNGEYIALTVVPDILDTGFKVKLNVSAAEALARTILAALR